MNDERVKRATQAILNLSGTWPNPEHAEFLARSILAVLETLQPSEPIGRRPDNEMGNGPSEFFINLENLAIALTNAEDDQGRKMMIAPEEVIPLVPEIARMVSAHRAGHLNIIACMLFDDGIRHDPRCDGSCQERRAAQRSDITVEIQPLAVEGEAN